MQAMTPHEINVYIERLKQDVARFIAHNDMPRSAAWQMPDKYRYAVEEKELTT